MTWELGSIAFRVMIVPSLLLCSVIICENAGAQVDSNTLESIVSHKGISYGSAQIDVGDSPNYIYSDPSLNATYISNSDSGTVSVIGKKTNDLIDVIPVGGILGKIYAYPRSDILYVANFGSQYDTLDGTLSVIFKNPLLKNKLGRILVGGSPTDIFADYSPRDIIFTANNNSGDVSVIDELDYRNITQISVGGSPTDIYGDLPVSNVIYVSNPDSGNISVINTTTYNSTQISLGGSPTYIYSNQSLDDLYVTDPDSGNISVINKKTHNVTDIQVGKVPTYIYGDPSLDSIYVANSGSDSLSLINSKANEVVAGVTFDISPARAGTINCDTELGGLDAPINRFFVRVFGYKMHCEICKWVRIR